MTSHLQRKVIKISVMLSIHNHGKSSIRETCKNYIVYTSEYLFAIGIHVNGISVCMKVQNSFIRYQFVRRMEFIFLIGFYNQDKGDWALICRSKKHILHLLKWFFYNCALFSLLPIFRRFILYFKFTKLCCCLHNSMSCSKSSL